MAEEHFESNKCSADEPMIENSEIEKLLESYEEENDPDLKEDTVVPQSEPIPRGETKEYAVATPEEGNEGDTTLEASDPITGKDGETSVHSDANEKKEDMAVELNEGAPEKDEKTSADLETNEKDESIAVAQLELISEKDIEEYVAAKEEEEDTEGNMSVKEDEPQVEKDEETSVHSKGNEKRGDMTLHANEPEPTKAEGIYSYAEETKEKDVSEYASLPQYVLLPRKETEEDVAAKPGEETEGHAMKEQPLPSSMEGDEEENQNVLREGSEEVEDERNAMSQPSLPSSMEGDEEVALREVIEEVEDENNNPIQEDKEASEEESVGGDSALSEEGYNDEDDDDDSDMFPFNGHRNESRGTCSSCAKLNIGHKVQSSSGSEDPKVPSNSSETGAAEGTSPPKDVEGMDTESSGTDQKSETSSRCGPNDHYMFPTCMPGTNFGNAGVRAVEFRESVATGRGHQRSCSMTAGKVFPDTRMNLNNRGIARPYNAGYQMPRPTGFFPIIPAPRNYGLQFFPIFRLVQRPRYHLPSVHVLQQNPPRVPNDPANDDSVERNEKSSSSQEEEDDEETPSANALYYNISQVRKIPGRRMETQSRDDGSYESDLDLSDISMDNECDKESEEVCSGVDQEDQSIAVAEGNEHQEVVEGKVEEMEHSPISGCSKGDIDVLPSMSPIIPASATDVELNEVRHSAEEDNTGATTDHLNNNE